MAESNPEINSLSSRMQRGQTDKEAKPVEINPGQINEIQAGKLHIEEMREIPLNLTQESGADSPTQIHGCDICMTESILTLSLYLCYVCGVYLCGKWLKLHDKSHELVKRKRGKIKRMENAERLVFKLREECDVKGGESLYGECVEVIGRVNLKHEFDKYDCDIQGLSGLCNKRWVAVDMKNRCLKIFCSISNTLLRYIKFGSIPLGVTEISDSASGKIIDISRTARDEQNKQCLLAVNFPLIKQIWFIDVNKTPAIKTKTIKMDERCWSINASEDKIFTLCREDVEFGDRYSVYILSTEGNQIKVIQVPRLSSRNIHHLAVYKGRVYLSDLDNEEVLCINVEDGKTISKLTLVEVESWLSGISVDHSNGVVYVCGNRNNKVYKLSPDLKEYEPLRLDTGYTERPFKLCFMNNKLFISHNDWLRSSLCNVVTVVHLLT